MMHVPQKPQSLASPMRLNAPPCYKVHVNSNSVLSHLKAYSAGFQVCLNIRILQKQIPAFPTLLPVPDPLRSVCFKPVSTGSVDDHTRLILARISHTRCSSLKHFCAPPQSCNLWCHSRLLFIYCFVATSLTLSMSSIQSSSPILRDEMPAFQGTSRAAYEVPARNRADSVPVPQSRGFSRTNTSCTQGRRQSAWEQLGLRRKNEMDIVLDGGDDFIHSYTTHDEIKGEVILKFEKDTAVDDLVITFEGLTFTYVEKIATTAPTTGRTTGRHTFLKLMQPVDLERLPENRIARAGVSYPVPFQFVVPDRLLPYCCSHRVENEEVKRAHLHLPPSLGDPSLAGDGQSLLDDLAPDMSKISYAVRARMAKRSPAGRQIDIVDKTRNVRIVPAKEEQPPINVEKDNADFVMRKEKSVRKGLFKIGKKVGHLTAEAAQPNSFRLPPPKRQLQEPVSTVATINVRFDPQSVDDQPPQLCSIVCKMRAITFFGAAPFKMMPFVKDMDTWSTLHGVYPETVEISTRSLNTVSWKRQEPNSTTPTSPLGAMRRPSTFSTDSTVSIPEPSTSYTGSHFFTTSLVIPLALPKNKFFVPSFHSCIVSRNYMLDLELSYKLPGATVSNSSIKLKVPIQVSSEEAHPHTLEAEAAIAAEIERQFMFGQAAGVQPPAPEYEQTQSTVPRYTETRHMSIDQAQQPAAPPEYYSSGSARMPARGSQAPRTTSVGSFLLRVAG